MVNTSIQIGGAVALAVITAIIGSGRATTDGQLLPGMTTAVAVVVGISVVGLLVTIARIAYLRRSSSDGLEGDVVSFEEPLELGGEELVS